MGPSVNDLLYGHCQLEYQFDSRSLGARKTLANYAQSRYSSAAGTQCSGVSQTALLAGVNGQTIGRVKVDLSDISQLSRLLTQQRI
jgi:hypothetical protein